MASREKALVKNTIILGLGRFLPKLVTIVTLPIVTAYLTKAEYGTYDLIQTLVMLLLPIATLEINLAGFRFLIDCRDDIKSSSTIISDLFFVILPMATLVSLCLFFFWSGIGFTARILIGVYFIVDALRTAVSQIARGLGNNKANAIAAVTLSVFTGIGIVLTLKCWDAGLNGVLFSMIMGNVIAIIYLFYVLRLKQYLASKYISFPKIKELLKYSGPMVPDSLSNWILKLSDRLVIITFLGIEANAVYAVANKIPAILISAQTVISMAWQENASIAASDGDASEYYEKMFNFFLGGIVGFTSLIISFTPVMYRLLIRGSYEEAYVQIPILVIATLFYCLSAYDGGIYVAHKKTISISVTTAAAAVINLTIDLLFVKRIGIFAGSISTLVAYLFLHIYRMLNVQKFEKIDFNIRKQILLIVILGIMTAVCIVDITVLNILNILFGMLLCGFLNKKLILKMLNMVKKLSNSNFALR